MRDFLASLLAYLFAFVVGTAFITDAFQFCVWLSTRVP